MANTKNLYINQGTSFVDYVFYLDAKTPFSLDGYSIKSQMRRSYTSANAISFVALVADSANGKISLTLEPYITANLVAGRYVYDVEGNIGNTIVRITEGIVTVNPGVTR